jgi:hypothetical protein
MTHQVVKGTYYHKDTSQKVIDTIECARLNNFRIVLDYGDVKTGRSWGELHDIKGYVGRSTGTIKIPLLIKTKRSSGGGSVLDNHIVKITEADKPHRVLYQHPTYKSEGN